MDSRARHVLTQHRERAFLWHVGDGRADAGTLRLFVRLLLFFLPHQTLVLVLHRGRRELKANRERFDSVQDAFLVARGQLTVLHSGLPRGALPFLHHSYEPWLAHDWLRFCFMAVASEALETKMAVPAADVAWLAAMLTPASAEEHAALQSYFAHALYQLSWACTLRLHTPGVQSRADYLRSKNVTEEQFAAIEGYLGAPLLAHLQALFAFYRNRYHLAEYAGDGRGMRDANAQRDDAFKASFVDPLMEQVRRLSV